VEDAQFCKYIQKMHNRYVVPSLQHNISCTTCADAPMTFSNTAVMLQAEMLTSTAMKAGFSGGLVVDFPHSTRAKKYFLVLMVGSSSYQPQAKGINGEDSEEDQEVQVASRQRGNKRRKTANGNIQVTKGLVCLMSWSCCRMVIVDSGCRFADH